MSKKLKIIPSLFKNKELKHPWQCPSCRHPRTLSFRSGNDDNDNNNPFSLQESSTKKHSSKYTSFSTDHVISDEVPQPLETVISSVRTSKRLFFEPEETSSILKHSKNGKSSSNSKHRFKDSVAMALESDDPYLDFKKSMEEMVESGGFLMDWDCLEELLLWYLTMNGKMNHRFIVGAFVDLLVGFAEVDSKKAMMVSGSTSTTSYSSAASSFSSSLSPRQL